MFCGSAFKNKGVQAMLDAVIEVLPAPTDIPPGTGTTEDESRASSAKADDEKFSALAFKIDDRPIRRPVDLLPRVFGRLNRATPFTTRSKGARSASVAVLQMHAKA